MNIQTVQFNGISFLNVTNPQELEIKHLRQEFGFSQLHLDDYLYKKQIPKIDMYKDYALIVLDFAFLEVPNGVHSEGLVDQINKIIQATPEIKEKAPPPPLSPQSPPRKRRVHTGHVNFFLGKEHLVVLHDQRLPQIDDIFANCQGTLKHREEYMSQGSMRLFYHIVNQLVDASFEVINDISATIDYIDRHVVEDHAPKVVEDISMTRRNLVVFHTMVKQAIPIFADLESNRHQLPQNDMSHFWQNIRDHLEKISERIDDSRELLDGIAVSNESVLTFRTNELMKFLTVITSMSFPFVIVNNLYSMNVKGLPFADQPWIVWVLFEVIAAGSLGVILYFRSRKWL